MEIILKAVSGILITVVLYHAISNQGKDISILLVIAVCCMVISAAFSYIRPVLEFFDQLRMTSMLNTQLLNILIKAVGIGLLAEVTSLICKDMGNEALGKSLQILASATILWLSLPLFTKLLDLLETVLGAV